MPRPPKLVANGDPWFNGSSFPNPHAKHSLSSINNAILQLNRALSASVAKAQ